MKSNYTKISFGEFLKSIKKDLYNINTCFTFAIYDLKIKFARTQIGFFWNLVQVMIWIGSLYLVFFSYFGIKEESFLLYISIGIILFFFFETTVNEACTLLQINRVTILSLNTSILFFFLRNFIKNLIIFFINFILVLCLLIFFGKIDYTLFLFLIYFPIYAMSVFFISFSAGLISTRYRDFNPIINVALRVLFILTPIFWTKKIVEDREYLVDYNPLFHLIELIRNPLMQKDISFINLNISICVLVFSLIISFFIYFNNFKIIKHWI